MRHADINITMQLYTDLRLADSARALDEVPAIGREFRGEAESALATGTTDQRAAHGAAPPQESENSLADLAAVVSAWPGLSQSAKARIMKIVAE